MGKAQPGIRPHVLPGASVTHSDRMLFVSCASDRAVGRSGLYPLLCGVLAVRAVSVSGPEAPGGVGGVLLGGDPCGGLVLPPGPAEVRPGDAGRVGQQVMAHNASELSDGAS